MKNNAQYWATIEKQYQSIAADVQGINAYRYPQITWGNQEFMEALSFQHYLENQTLISYEDSKARVATLSGDGPKAPLTPEDYVLGIFDMIGELMRFSITMMATNGKLPAGRPKAAKKGKQESTDEQSEKMEVDEQSPNPGQGSEEAEPRDVLSDLRELQLRLEMFDPREGPKFPEEAGKKMVVMRECIEKVEKALYSLTVRGKERPQGWVPDLRENKQATVEGY